MSGACGQMQIRKEGEIWRNIWCEPRHSQLHVHVWGQRQVAEDCSHQVIPSSTKPHCCWDNSTKTFKNWRISLASGTQSHSPPSHSLQSTLLILEPVPFLGSPAAEGLNTCNVEQPKCPWDVVFFFFFENYTGWLRTSNFFFWWQ
jgi:hypothetical protein